MDAADPLLGGLASSLFVALGLYVSYTLSLRILGEVSVSVRWCGAAVSWLWLLLAIFHGLAPFHCFTIQWGLGVWICLAGLTRLLLDRGFQTPGSLWRDLSVARARLRQILSEREALFYWAGGAMLLFAVTRAIAAPPLAWDSLTYHLFRAGKWVQEGGTFALEAPDAWSYYQYFPGNGEVISAWFMLPFHGDFAVGLVNFPLWALAVLSFYALARWFDVRVRYAALGALLLGFTPVMFSYMVTAYVEIGLLAELLCGVLFVLRASRGGWVGNVLVAFAAFGLALGTKMTAVPLMIAGIGFCVCSMASGDRLRQRRRNVGPGPPRQARKSALDSGAGPAWRRIVWLAVALVPAAVVSLPWYRQAFLDHGSPTYPFPVQVFGRTVFAGSEALTDMLAAKASEVAGDPMRTAYQTVLPFLPNSRTLGPLAIVSLFAVPFGVGWCWRRGLRLATLFLLASAAVISAGYYSTQMEGIRLYWAASSSRFLTFPLALLLLWTVAALERRGRFASRLRVILLSLFAVNLVLVYPAGFGGSELALVGGTTIGVGFASWFWVVVAHWARRLGRPTRLAAGILLLFIGLVCIPVVEYVRNEWRYSFLEASYELHDFRRKGLPAWRSCDRPRDPSRTAFTAGWNGTGHNWFWYPLLGRHLQNAVTYVPITADGRVIDYARTEEIAKSADFRGWLGNLLEERIDIVVCFPPETPESKWMQQYESVFLQIAGDEQVGVYELLRDRARLFLQTSSGRREL